MVIRSHWKEKALGSVKVDAAAKYFEHDLRICVLLLACNWARKKF